MVGGEKRFQVVQDYVQTLKTFLELRYVNNSKHWLNSK